MLDTFNREINYMRVSVTDRCNLRCVYCMPEDTIIDENDFSNVLSYEQIYEIVKVASTLGINKIRLTGGEPLVRKDLHNLVKMIRTIKNIKIIAMTTNGILLSKFAYDLKEAGLDSINISLDTLSDERYKQITRGGNIKDTISGIEVASKLGFKLKINVVVYDDISRNELPKLREYAHSMNADLQTIQYYNVNETKRDTDLYDRPMKCIYCNKIRLLADGYLLSCLHSNLKTKVDFNNIEKSIRECIKIKPEKGDYSDVKSLSLIGG